MEAQVIHNQLPIRSETLFNNLIFSQALPFPVFSYSGSHRKLARMSCQPGAFEYIYVFSLSL